MMRVEEVEEEEVSRECLRSVGPWGRKGREGGRSWELGVGSRSRTCFKGN